ncbi:MAG TPA: ATP-binding protein [Candidatus Omnitrophota bacterium]|nr:ATP-binding protein [Candidatus Omnitrophota bacterium]HPD85547.1 ATP-binding protein [Candidatus Omnitrophota bacterium]HRZ04413.1 ATP-binding protein [Candidatus Omnitrophota bacterium]
MYRFPTDLKSVKHASKKILDSLSDLKLDSSLLFDIKLSFEEALINAMKHGNKNDPRLTVDVDVVKGKDAVEIVVRDQGEGFDHTTCKNPTHEKNLERCGGRGVFLIRKLMDKVIFERNGSCLRMIKKLKKKRGAR